MHRYKPDIAWPAASERSFPHPEPTMAEDNDEGQYYAKDEVDRRIEALEIIVRFCATLDIGPKGYCSMPLYQLREQALNALQSPMENYIGSLGLSDQP